MGGDSNQGETRSGNRWWESYLPRYLSGFIVGTLCVVILIAHAIPIENAAKLLGPVAPLILPDHKPVPSKTLSLKSVAEPQAGLQTSPVVTYEVQESGSVTVALAILGLGVAFCYLSSAPITVLHAGRMYNSWINRQARGMWLGWILALLTAPMIWQATSKLSAWSWMTVRVEWFAFGVVMALNLLIDPLSRCARARLLWVDEQGNERARASGLTMVAQCMLWAAGMLLLTDIVRRSCWMAPTWFLLAAPALWIGVSQYFTLAHLWLDETHYVCFTRKLAVARKGAFELRETYTHLREHSNAVFIVVIELCLLALILGILRPYSGDLVKLEGARSATGMPLSTAIALVVMWLVPTIFMWARANRLERSLVLGPAQSDLVCPTSQAGQSADPPATAAGSPQ